MHSIKSVLCYEEVNEMDSIKSCFLSLETFRIPKMLFDGPIVYLRHTWNIDQCLECVEVEKNPFLIMLGSRGGGGGQWVRTPS